MSVTHLEFDHRVNLILFFCLHFSSFVLINEMITDNCQILFSLQWVTDMQLTFNASDNFHFLNL